MKQGCLPFLFSFWTVFFYLASARCMEENLTLYQAGSKCDCDRVRALLVGCADNLLHKAVRNNDLKRLHLFLGLGADVHKKNKQGKSSLHVASCDNNKDIVQVLLDAGANIEDTDENGDTSLHKASRWANTSVARLLLERGADIFARDKNGNTPLHRIFPFQYKMVLLSLVSNAVLTEKPCGDESIAETTEDKVTQAMLLLKVKNRKRESPEDCLRQKRILEIFNDELRRCIKARLQEHVSTTSDDN